MSVEVKGKKVAKLPERAPSKIVKSGVGDPLALLKDEMAAQKDSREEFENCDYEDKKAYQWEIVDKLYRKRLAKMDKNLEDMTDFLKP